MSAALPDFLVIGAYKSGTTALHEGLRSHPQVYVPDGKGPSFFAFDEAPTIDRPLPAGTVRRLEDYEHLFDARDGELVAGEVSPEYLANPWACGRIRERVPDARLVAILRNPVERAFSDYLMYVRDGLEPHADFGRALDEQEERRRAGLATGYYVETGFYGRQLSPYFESFPRERIHVLLFEDFAADPGAALPRLYEFLGVDPALARMPGRAINVSGIPRNVLVASAIRGGRRLAPLLPPSVRRQAKSFLARGLDRPSLGPEHRRRLVELYRADVAELESLLGRPLGHWLEGPG